MGDNVEALYENSDGRICITFKSDEGEPLLIFIPREARIERITNPQRNKRQLLLRVQLTHYILTFSNNAEARQFSGAMLFDLKVRVLFIDKDFPKIKERFESNDITIDPRNE